MELPCVLSRFTRGVVSPQRAVSPQRTVSLRRAVSLLLPALLPASLFGQSLEPGDVSEPLLTRAEATGFRETTRYAGVMAFVRSVAEADPRIQLTTYGYTFEGRPLPLLVVGDVDDPSPEGVRRSGKTRVYVQGGIHAGEIAGKEALLILLRELSRGEHAHWSDSLVLLVAPLFNADGNERVNLRNRRRQHGPVGGMGQRYNALGLDLNRDQMKLDGPESRSLVRLYNQYDPHVSVDLHTTNGTRHGYHLTYAPPLSPNTPRAMDAFLREEWLPAMTRGVKDETGWDFYYYGGTYWRRGSGQEQGWYTFDHRPRFVSNYIGIRNRFGVLGEAYAYATFRDRIDASYWLVVELLEFAHTRASEIRSLTREADARSRSLVGDSLALRAVHERSSEPVTILMGEVEEDRNPFTGEIMLRRTDVQNPVEMYEYGTFQPTEWARVPSAYYVSAELAEVRERLQAHGIRIRELEEARSAEVEVFTVDSVRTAEREYQGRSPQEVWGSWQIREEALEPGTVVVPMDQPLARLAFTLLEPRSDDGFVAWAFLTDVLEAGHTYPVMKASPEAR